MRYILSIFTVFILTPTAWTSAEESSVYFEVLEIAKAGDIEGLQNLFEEVEKERVATGDAREHSAAFDAFHNTHPLIESAVLDWQEAYPDAAHPHAARAARLMNEALIVRGSDFVRNTPSASMRRMSELMDEAQPLIERALELDPTHLFAAVKLSEIGRWRSNASLRERANLIIDQHRHPSDTFWSNLYQVLPQWGGNSLKINEYCARGALELEDVSLSQCKLIAEIYTRPRKISPQDALSGLDTEFPGKMQALRVQLNLELRRFDDVKDLIVDEYPPDPGSLKACPRSFSTRQAP